MEPVSEDLGLLLVEQFREQMNNLAAAVQLLTPVVQEKGGCQYEPYLAILHQSMYRMMRMLGNLEYLQLPEDELTVTRTSLDLAGLCRGLGEQVASLAGQAGLEFSYEEERGSLITTGDGPQLRRMLLGLISNAFRAAGKGGIPDCAWRCARTGRCLPYGTTAPVCCRRRRRKSRSCSTGPTAWALACGWPGGSPPSTAGLSYLSSGRTGVPGGGLSAHPAAGGGRGAAYPADRLGSVGWVLRSDGGAVRRTALRGFFTR